MDGHGSGVSGDVSSGVNLSEKLVFSHEVEGVGGGVGLVGSCGMGGGVSDGVGRDEDEAEQVLFRLFGQSVHKLEQYEKAVLSAVDWDRDVEGMNYKIVYDIGEGRTTYVSVYQPLPYTNDPAAINSFEYQMIEEKKPDEEKEADDDEDESQSDDEDAQAQTKAESVTPKKDLTAKKTTDEHQKFTEDKEHKVNFTAEK